MENKTQKDLEDEYFLQLEKDMKSMSEEADKVFWFDYLEEEKKVKDEQRHTSSWYEILIITLFIILGFLSIYLKWHFYVVAIWLFIIFFFSWFSEKLNETNRIYSKVSNPFYYIFYYIFYNIFYKFWFYEEKWLYSKLNILNLIFIIIYGPIFLSELSLAWFILWPFFLWIGPLWFCVCRFVVEIFKFIRRAIRWEVDWNKVFNQVLTIAIIWILFRMWMKYDVFLWIGNRLQNQS